jgi:hypothetical protein
MFLALAKGAPVVHFESWWNVSMRAYTPSFATFESFFCASLCLSFLDGAAFHRSIWLADFTTPLVVTNALVARNRGTGTATFPISVHGRVPATRCRYFRTFGWARSWRSLIACTSQLLVTKADGRAVFGTGDPEIKASCVNEDWMAGLRTACTLGHTWAFGHSLILLPQHL